MYLRVDLPVVLSHDPYDLLVVEVVFDSGLLVHNRVSSGTLDGLPSDLIPDEGSNFLVREDAHVAISGVTDHNQLELHFVAG